MKIHDIVHRVFRLRSDGEPAGKEERGRLLRGGRRKAERALRGEGVLTGWQARKDARRRLDAQLPEVQSGELVGGRLVRHLLRLDLMLLFRRPTQVWKPSTALLVLPPEEVREMMADWPPPAR